MAQLAPNWYDLGTTLLDVEQASELKVIHANKINDVRECCSAMLQYWIDTHPEATWVHLVTALKSPGLNLAAVASDIEQHFIPIGKLCHH